MMRLDRLAALVATVGPDRTSPVLFDLRVATEPGRAASPDWLGALHDRLAETADRLRTALLEPRMRPAL